MIMRYYGGGIGHMSNTPTQQADPLDPPTDEMAEDDAEEDTGGAVRDGPQPEDAIMHEGEQGADEINRSGDNTNEDSEVDADDYDYNESYYRKNESDDENSDDDDNGEDDGEDNRDENEGDD